MNALPIFRRELLVRARRPATYRLRPGVVAAGLVFSLPFWMSIGAAPKIGGKVLFDALVGCMFALACTGCFFAADTISREKREGSLGLLLVTRVNTLDLVLGKFGSMGLLALSSLIVLCPLLMLPLLTGGVTGGEVLRKSLALLNSLCLAVAVGLYSSASQDRLLGSARQGVLWILGIFVLPLWPLHFASAPARWLGLFSPVSALLIGADSPYNAGGQAGEYWACMIIVQAETWLMLLGTARRLRRGFAEPAPLITPKRHLPLSAAAAEQEEIRWNPRLLSPVEWLVYRQPGVKAAFWGAAAMIGVLQSWIVPLLVGFVGRAGARSYVWMQVPSFTLGLISSTLLAWGITRFILEARQTGALELILTTPVGYRDVVTGQWAALKRMLRGPVLLMAIPMLAQLVVSFRVSPSAQWGSDFLLIAVSMANVFLSVAAFCWVGLLFASRASGHTGAVVRTLLVAKGVPYLASVFGWMVTFRLLQTSVGVSPASIILGQGIAALVKLAIYLVLIHVARARLAKAGALKSQPLLDWAAEFVRKARVWPSTG